MITKTLSMDDPVALSEAGNILLAGGMVIFPTDTVYGLGATAFSTEAIEQLYQAKERSASKAIAVLIGDLDQLIRVAGKVSGSARMLAHYFWPGGLTIVVERHPSLPAILSPQATIGVRMPDHNFARALLRLTGPLATTSANLAGGANPRNLSEVLAQLEGRVGLVIDGGEVRGGIPSTVVDCTGEMTSILRQGAIAEEDIRTALRL